MRPLLASFLGVVFFLSNVSVSQAVDVEKIPTMETISSQSINSDEVVSPYHVSGEALVYLIKNMVNFKTPGTKIVFNRKTGQMYVRNTPSNHDIIANMLMKLRETQFQQIRIEARIATVKSTDDSALGLDFLGVKAVNDKKDITYGTDSTATHDGIYNTFTQFPPVHTTDGDTLGGQLSVGAISKDFDIATLIDALKSRYEVNTLSAPQLMVSNNQRAHIKIEKAKYYIQSISTNVTADGDNLALETGVGVAETGTILDVTPTVNADNTIALELHPQFASVDMSNTRRIVVLSTDVLAENLQPSVTLPVFNVQTANTTITIQNGGVAVIGGLIEENEQKAHYKIPVLGDIPLVGKLCFQSNRTQEVKTHLIIFVKATIQDTHKSNL
jgi:type II secretory pathway component GspD/PulD (secretin)